ncbi:MAG: hypothetical protein LLG01_10240, partial [Planctomycetaceae bacterium]|nr:hypothetical protein [Planctomycetaceae bacterium]
MSPSSHAIKLLNKLYGYVFRRSMQENSRQFAYPTLESLEPRLLLSSVYKIDNAAVVEDNSGSKSAVFTVLRSGDTELASSVDYATADSTAAAGSDYQAASGTLQFTAGQTSRTISVSVYGDVLNELNETFFVNLSNPTGDSAVETAQGVGTIYNDDTAAAIKGVQRGSATLASGSSSMTVTLASAVDMSKAFVIGTERTGGTSPQNRVTYELIDSTTLLFTRNENSNVDVSIDWQVVEFSQGISVQRGVTTFGGSDEAQNVAISSVDLGKAFVLTSERTSLNSISKDGEWTTRARLSSGANLELTRMETGTPVSVAWQVIEFTDTTTTVQSGLTSITAGNTAVTVDLASAVDPASAFMVFTRRTSTGDDGLEAQYQTRGRMISSTQLTFDRVSSIHAVDIAWFVISMPGSSVQSGAASFTTSGATATLLDVPVTSVESLSRAMTIISARGSADPYKNALDDTSVTATLTDDSNLRLQREGTRTTTDVAWSLTQFDQPRLAFESATSQSDESIATWLIPVSLSTVSGQTVTVNYAVTGGTATDGTDYTLASGTLTFAAGQTRQFITLSVADDDLLDELDETLVITLSDPTNARLGAAANEPASHTHTIINNASPAVLALALDPATIDENGTASVHGAFTDAGTQDSHVVTINWGDGSDSTVIELAAGARTFDASHQYLNDSGAGAFTVTAAVVDNHGGTGSASTPVTVSNVAPSDLHISLSASAIDE